MLGNWVKFPTDVLINRHYGLLPPRLWQLAGQLRLMKGMKPEDPILPPLEDILWATRTTAPTDITILLKELEELRERGILDFDGKNWIYPNIVEEGEPDSAKARKARQRANNPLSRSGHEPITICDPERGDVERKDKDQNRAEEEVLGTAPAVLAGDLAKRLTASLEGASPDLSDDAFWERQKSLRPDLCMEKVKEKLETYCRENRKKLTREYAEAWVKREKTPLEEIPPIKSKKTKIDVAFEEEAFKWRSEHYPDSINPSRHPTWKTLPFKDWPTETQKEFSARHNQS